MRDHGRFRKYLQFEKGYSSHTVAAYLRDLRAFDTYTASHLGMHADDVVHHTHIRSWMVFLMKEGYQPRSINRKLSTLKTYFKFAKKNGWIATNPAGKIMGPKVPKRLPKVVRAEEMELGLQMHEEDRDDFSKVRDYVIVLMLYQTGMRRSELIQLMDTDINRQRREIKVLGKGNKERMIPVETSLLSWLDKYQGLRGRQFGEMGERLLVTDRGRPLYPKFVYNCVSKWIQCHSTVDKRSPHILRHSFATHLSDNGAELNAIKELLGHANLTATQIYTHNGISKLKEIYSKAHPKGA